MKRIFTLISIFSLFFSLNAQNSVIIQGQVTDQSTGNGVPGYLVNIISDSTNPGFFYFNSVITDNQGFYSDTAIVPSGSQLIFNVLVVDCNGIPQFQSGVSTNSPIVANFSICAGGSVLCSNFFTTSTNGLAVNFSGGTNSGNPVMYDWSFGDGTTGTGQNISHTYTQAGTYNVILTTTDSIQGCVATSTQHITVGTPSPCQANFLSYQDSTFPGYNYFFVNLSLGSNLSYSWDFGDGNTSTLNSPQHTFSQPGTYQVCLTVTDASGCQSTFCDSLIVSAAPQCLAYFNFALNGQTITFANQSYGAAPLTYSWDFGDGNTSTAANPTHTYASSGLVTITLNIMDATGCQSSYTVQTFIYGPGGNCQSMFTYASDSVNPALINFTNLSTSGLPQGAIVSYQWDFGDGNTSSQASPAHLYAANGSYHVCLAIVAADPQGSICTSIYCDTVQVVGSSGCYAVFGYQVNGQSVDFQASGTGSPPFTYSWDFGDGSIGNGSTPTHTYSGTGSYVVTLTMTDSSGCTAISAQLVTVGPATNLQIIGQVTADSLPAGQTSVILMGFSSATGMFMIDTTTTDPTGSFIFAGLSQGFYTLRAEPLASSPLFMSYAPTYYGGAAHWGNASLIQLGVPQNPYNISLLPIPGSGTGPAMVGGTVTGGGNKSSLKNGPMHGVGVMLKSQSGQMLDMRYSDASGNFDFSDIPFGTYEVYAEVPGLPTTPATVILNQANPVVTNISIVVMNSGVITTIPNELSSSDFKIYPNPATDKLFIESLKEDASGYRISLFSIDGRLLQEFNLIGIRDRMEINLDNTLPGLHLLQIENAEGYQIHEKIIIR